MALLITKNIFNYIYTFTSPGTCRGRSDCRQRPRHSAEDFSLKEAKVSIFKTFKPLLHIMKISKSQYFHMMTQETEKEKTNADRMYRFILFHRIVFCELSIKQLTGHFIYDLVRDTYSDGMGRPSIDPVTLAKIPLIQYLYGIKSMRQTIKEIEVNMAYRWFSDLNFMILFRILYIWEELYPSF